MIHTSRERGSVRWEFGAWAQIVVGVVGVLSFLKSVAASSEANTEVSRDDPSTPSYECEHAAGSSSPCEVIVKRMADTQTSTRSTHSRCTVRGAARTARCRDALAASSHGYEMMSRSPDFQTRPNGRGHGIELVTTRCSRKRKTGDKNNLHKLAWFG